MWMSPALRSMLAVGTPSARTARLQSRLPSCPGCVAGLRPFWISTGSQVGTQGWSEMTVVLNTQTDTVNVNVRAYDDLNATLGGAVSILTGQSLGVDANALTDLRWDLRGGTLDNGAVSYKNYFDDFSFNVAPVPEPGSVLGVALGTILLLRRSRRLTF